MKDEYRIRERTYTNGRSTFLCEVLSRSYGNWNPLPGIPTFESLEEAKQAVNDFRGVTFLVRETIHEV